jgi:glycosyltransferase involved in cell wall biosynthesis
MKRVLFIGEHPYSHTGNGNMMAAIIKQLDKSEYDLSVYSVTKADIPPFVKVPFSIIQAEGQVDRFDEFGLKKLVNIIAGFPDLHLVVSIGIDVWRLASIFQAIDLFRKKKNIRFAAIFPYDLHMPRADWVSWINSFDIPLVYSKWGHDILKPIIPNVRYFRPPLNMADSFVKYEKPRREAVRRDLFSTIPSDGILFGFVGANQIRKDPQRLFKAFFHVKKEIPNIYLYMHTRFVDGVFNLQQAAMDYGAGPGDLVIMNQNSNYTRDKMVDIYNSMDVYINPSFQEGLSWTVIEAMLCGIPVIASDSTAHKELTNGASIFPIPCTDISYLPMFSERGPSWVETRACNFDALADSIRQLALDANLRKELGERGKQTAQSWLSGVDNINTVLLDLSEMVSHVGARENKILFAQHSSAGDVLMSTQCFKGIKERHPGLPLVYMTQKQFMDIVEENPYLDEIIEWDSRKQDLFMVTYNPHGDRILPGGFNNLDVKLHSMYPYFTKVKPDDIYIKPVDPGLDLPPEYIVVHTTGGDPYYRTYKAMDVVIDKIGFPVIQIGGASDFACRKADFDLRGKLTWRQTAWVMKGAKAAVVIDSYPAHLAGALGTPVVVLFGPAPARVTAPRGEESKIICLEPNKLDVCPNLTNCWGRPGEERCKAPCILTISPLKVRKALKTLLEGGSV